MNAGLQRLVMLLIMLLSGTKGESLDEFVQKELRFIETGISVKIIGAANVDKYKLLRRVSELQGKAEDYYKSKNIYDFGWWLYEIHYSVESGDLDKRILEMLNGSSELVDEIKKRYPDSGVFHSENVFAHPVEHSNYFDRAIQDDQRLKQLRESCLEKIAQEFYSKYGSKDIFEGEAYKRFHSHKNLHNDIVDSLNKHITMFAGESEDCGQLIKKMVDINAEYYRKTAG